MGGMVWFGLVSRKLRLLTTAETATAIPRSSARGYVHNIYGLSNHPPNHARHPYRRRLDLHAPNYTAIIPPPNLLSPLPSPSLV
jgi:hypothetical protein